MFPDVRRNAGTQSQSGGVDLENTAGFSFEIKGGKRYKSRMIRKILDQAEKQRKEGSIVIALVKPSREKAYGIMPLEDLLRLIRFQS